MAVISAKVKIIATAAVIVLLVGGTATVVYNVARPKSRVVTLGSSGSTPSNTAPIPLITSVGKDAWRARLNQVYSLQPGQDLKHVPNPFIPERAAYLTSVMSVGNSIRASSIDRATAANTACFFNFDREPYWTMEVYHTLNFLEVAKALTDLRQCDFEGLSDLVSLKLPGDWVVRKDTPKSQRLAALANIVNQEFGQDIRLVPRTVERDVLVASGNVSVHPLPKKSANVVAIYLEDRKRNLWMTAGSVSDFLGDLSDLTGIKIINETTPPLKQIFWSNFVKPQELAGSKTAQEHVLKNIADQSGITFRHERRPVEIWFVEPQSTQTQSAAAK